ncbi:hypothetical protein Tco_1100192, partial [Tanacetum coccineum]
EAVAVVPDIAPEISLEAPPSSDYVPALPDYVSGSNPEEEPEEDPSEDDLSSDDVSQTNGLENLLDIRSTRLEDTKHELETLRARVVSSEREIASLLGRAKAAKQRGEIAWDRISKL